MRICLQNPDELKEILDRDPDSLSIIDARSKQEYQQWHIPEARHLAWEDWCAKAPENLNPELQQAGYWGRLSDLENKLISERLSALGLQNDKPVLVYADGPKSKGREGRIAWMLLYLGATEMRILNGGFSAWLNRGYAVSRQNPEISSKCMPDFEIRKDSSRRVILAELQSMLAAAEPPLLIDTRTPKEFRGESYDYMPRTGTIPGAHLLAYKHIFKADGSFIDKSTYLELLPGKTKPEQKLVAFCEVGVRACTVALIHEIYCQSVVAVYDGSLMEWGADANLPMTKS